MTEVVTGLYRCFVPLYPIWSYLIPAGSQARSYRGSQPDAEDENMNNATSAVQSVQPRTVSYAGVSYQEVRPPVFHHTRGAGVPFRSYLFRALSEPEMTTQTLVSSLAPSQTVDYKNEKRGVISPIGPSRAYDTEIGPLGSYSRPLVVGFDSEWQVREGLGTRDILTAQLAFRADDGEIYVWVLEYPHREQKPIRLRQGTLLSWFFADIAEIIGFETYRKGQIAEGEKEPLFNVVAVAHYGIVDWTTFFNRHQILTSTDSVRRTLVSVEKPLFEKVWTADRNESRSLVIHLRDTMLLAPAGSSLKVLGAAMHYPKIELPEGYEKDEMRRVLTERRSAYMVYAATDSVLEVMWVEQMTNASNVRVPVTLGGQAAKELREGICLARGWDKKTFDYEFRGLASVADPSWDPSAKRRKKKMLVPRPEAELLLTAASGAYYGGRNEAFLHGIHHAENGWYDFDLSGAYPTAMCLIADPDYSAPPLALTGRLSRGIIQPNAWCFAHVRFRFPAGTLYPCLPVKDAEGRGLIFPMAGSAWASAPELWLALELGAEIELTQPAFLQPTNRNFSLGEGILALVAARAEAKARYGKGSPQELAAKEKANSAYGKMAQGLAGKRAYSTRYDMSRDIPPSQVTSAPQAALTTGLVRATVSAAMIQLGALGYRIASVTTDGFLTDAPEAVLKGLDLFGFRNALGIARATLADSDEIWELKHAARSLVMLKTRGGFGVGEIDGHKLPHAGAGFKVSGGLVGEVARRGHSEPLAEVFLQREGTLCFGFHALPSPRDYVRKNADGVGKDVKKQIGWEWDYKREPDDATVTTEIIEIAGKVYDHVSYATRPWDSIDDFLNARAVTDESRDAVKTVDDHMVVKRRIARRPDAVAAGVRVRGGLARSEAISVLRGLRAGVLQASWYVPGTTKGTEVCQRVGNAFGVELDANDWKNAGRPSRAGRVVLEGLGEKLDEIGAYLL